MKRWMCSIWLCCACGDVVKPVPAPGAEVSVASGRLRGKTLVVDVQVGAIEVRRTEGAELDLVPASPIVP
jgi:hypothetical protein